MAAESRSIATSATLASLAALAAPACMAVGLFIWADTWKGSPFALNAFKNTAATVAFVAVALATPSSPFQGSTTSLLYLLLSGFLGITLGDTAWLVALKHLGARVVLLFDALKPFCAAAFGHLVLHEPALPPLAYAGVAVTTAGVAIAAAKPKGSEDAERPALTPAVAALAFGAAIANVLLDTYGAVLTKQHGGEFTAFEVSAIRFGSSAALLLGGGAAAHATLHDSSWARMPRMDRASWFRVLCGIALTTFAASAFSVYAVVRLPLPVYAALTGLAPVFALPIGRVVHGQPITPRACIGALLACGGVVMMAL